MTEHVTPETLTVMRVIELCQGDDCYARRLAVAVCRAISSADRVAYNTAVQALCAELNAGGAK